MAFNDASLKHAYAGFPAPGNRCGTVSASKHHLFRGVWPFGAQFCGGGAIRAWQRFRPKQAEHAEAIFHGGQDQGREGSSSFQHQFMPSGQDEFSRESEFLGICQNICGL